MRTAIMISYSEDKGGVQNPSKCIDLVVDISTDEIIYGWNYTMIVAQYGLKHSFYQNLKKYIYLLWITDALIITTTYGGIEHYHKIATKYC